jgi:hypothetical protein
VNWAICVKRTLVMMPPSESVEVTQPIAIVRVVPENFSAASE